MFVLHSCVSSAKYRINVDLLVFWGTVRAQIVYTPAVDVMHSFVNLRDVSETYTYMNKTLLL